MKEKIYRVRRSVQKKCINELRDDNSKYGEDKNFKVQDYIAISDHVTNEGKMYKSLIIDKLLIFIIEVEVDTIHEEPSSCLANKLL